MSTVTFYPSRLSGLAAVPPSKSEVHRALLLAALGRGECALAGFGAPLCDDTEAMLDGIRALGASVSRDGDILRVMPAKGVVPMESVPTGSNAAYSAAGTADCLSTRTAAETADYITARTTAGAADSPVARAAAGAASCTDVDSPIPRVNVRACAAALRMLIPAFLSRGQGVAFDMADGLYRRPLDAYDPLIKRLGASMSLSPPIDGAPATLALNGIMLAGDYEIDGSPSSQFASGLLIALAHAVDERGAPAPSRLVIVKPIVSRPYIDMTLRLMAAFGLSCAEESEGVFMLEPSVVTSPREVRISGDWSQAAALLCANALGSGITLTGMSGSDGANGCLSAYSYAGDPQQGDARILQVLCHMGLRISRTADRIHAAMPSRDALAPIELNCSDIPDIAPLIALVCARARGRSVLTGVGRLRAKECDRLQATIDLLSYMGVCAETTDDALTVHGGATLHGGFTFNARDDHRMVMLAAIAALTADAPITVEGAEAVGKSWRSFIEDYRRLGGKTN